MPDAHLTTHGVSVDLAHVRAGIVLLDVRHVQFPCVVSVVRDRQSRIVSHHVRVYRQNRSGIRLYPGYLETSGKRPVLLKTKDTGFVAINRSLIEVRITR